MRIELPYKPEPKQALLHAATASEILWGGAAGGGKSHGLRWDAYEFCMKNPGCVAVLVRQTLPQLEKNHIRKVRRELPAELGSYNETRKVFNWWNGSILAFQHLEYDKDLNDFQGDEIHWLGVDEASLLQPEHLAEIKTRCRLGDWKPTDPHAIARLPRLAMTANPGGPSHQYLKENYIDPAPESEMFEHLVKVRDRTIAKTRIFIRATMDDNPHLDEDYEAQFGDLQDWRIKQLRDGDWDVVPGAFFDCWDPHVHVVQPFEVPAHWPRYRSCDWGFATPFSIGEWTVSDGIPVVQRDGSRVVYPKDCSLRVWEWYGGKKSKGLRLDALEVAGRVVKARGRVLPGPGDTNMWEADNGPSPAEKFMRAGMPFFKADKRREAGWQEMYRRLKTGMLRVTSDCRDFIRTIPAQMADPMNPNDVKKKGDDHCFVGDSLVLTSEGYRPIKELSSGWCWTPAGWRRFRNARKTRAAETVFVDFEDTTIQCTPDHRFLTESGWVEAQDLEGHRCYNGLPSFNRWSEWSRSLAKRFRNSAASGITSAAATFSATASACIAPFTSMFTVRSLMDTTFTMTTMTAQTTSRGILSSYPASVTPLSTRPSAMPSKSARSWRQGRQRPASGTAATKAASGIKSNTRSTAVVPFEKRGSARRVGNAESDSRGRSTSSFARTSARRRTAIGRALMTLTEYASFAAGRSERINTKNRKHVRVRAAGFSKAVQSVRPGPVADVYCLTVPANHVFTVQGVAVANCADETRYFVMSRPLQVTGDDSEEGFESYAGRFENAYDGALSGVA